MEVTVGDQRFDRYYRRIRLGLRLMSHGARAQTASDWSGLTLDQLVTLRKRWMPDAVDGFRGPSPKSFIPFFRSALKASHAAIFVGIHRMVGTEASEPSLEGGEKLCEAYEIYREWEPDDHLEFDYGVLLATGAMKGQEIELSTCADCGCAILVDKLKIPQLRCVRCRSKTRKTIQR
jgi:predicted Zn-ribbon and HTH transcriptional regulator